MPGTWEVDERSGSAGELHASWPAADRDPTVRWVGVCRPTRPAIVLGSTQSSDVVDWAAAASAGLEVVRRRSGGGAVLVTPDDPVWVDVWVPAGDALWKADVTGAFGWLGSTWARALEGLGLTGVDVQGPAPGACTRWSSILCFAGVGAGEVSVGGRKVVGLAQRRNRSGAWFHGACLLRWDPTLLLATLDLPPAEREVATAGLAPAVAGVADALGSASGPSRDAVTTALLGSLPGSPGVG